MGGGKDGRGGNVFALAAARADLALDSGKGRGISGATTAMTTTTTHKQALVVAMTAIAHCPSPKRPRIVGPSCKSRHKSLEDSTEGEDRRRRRYDEGYVATATLKRWL